MQWPPAVVVHGLDHVTAALAVGLPVTLLSGRGAGVYGGVGWWRAMLRAAGATHPDILDCADAAGAAMAALRGGQLVLILNARAPGYLAVRGAAQSMGAEVLSVRPGALDLAQPAAARLLPRWLAADDVAPSLR